MQETWAEGLDFVPGVPGYCSACDKLRHTQFWKHTAPRTDNAEAEAAPAALGTAFLTGWPLHPRHSEGWYSWIRFPHVSSSSTRVTSPTFAGSPRNFTPRPSRRWYSCSMLSTAKAVCGIPAS